MAMQWSQALALGVESIDSQHRELFGRIQALHAALLAGEAPVAVESLFQFLRTYVDEHFRDEEALMSSHAYPGLPNHRRQHAQFVAVLEELRREFERDGSSTALAVNVQRRVRDWLVGHIGMVDREFGDFLKRRPERPA